MPTYTFQKSDGTTLRKKLTFAEYEQVRTGDLKIKDDSGDELVLVFNPGNIGLVLKDGPSGGWASKALKENAYRSARVATLKQKERDNVFKPKLIPNYMGEEAPSWKEAQEEARSKEGSAVAKTYDRLVAKEKSKK